MWAIAGGEGAVTACPENVICTILYAFRIVGGGGEEKKERELISELLALQSKQNMAPPLCNAFCIVTLMLQLQQYVGSHTLS